MVSTSGRDTGYGDRRQSERRRTEKPISVPDRRVATRRSGTDRRRDPRT